MKFLVDANLSPRVAAALIEAGFDAVHVAAAGLLTASDAVILERAKADGLTIISSDTDFGALLSQRGSRLPSVVLLRRVNELSPDQHAELLIANLPTAAEDIEGGAIVTMEPTRLRVRRLPIAPTG